MSTPDYSSATWHGAYYKNYTNASRPGSNPINKIVIHVTQGSWASAINWFNTKDQFGPGEYGVSAHYTVRSSDGHIGQSVQEQDIAHHAGNWTYNQTSVGIEHEGYVSDPQWFTDAMYRSSAKLTAYLCKKYGIPIDRTHIIGHVEVPGTDHTDPGRYWNWTKYMDLVRSYAGTSTSSSVYKQVVDNSSPRFSASGAWDVSSYSAQRFGTNYRYTNPRRVNDPARYKFKVPKRGKYAVFARWPANSGYNDRTRFLIRTTSGWKVRAVNQRTNGGKWIRLGIFNLKAGDTDYVRISRNSPGSGYVIADAALIKKVG